MDEMRYYISVKKVGVEMFLNFFDYAISTHVITYHEASGRQ
jgi:hypothetical protein